MSIHIIGLGMDWDNLPEVHTEIIERAEVLVGGKRQLARFDEYPFQTIPITAPIDDVLAQVEALDNMGKEVVVLADGDPLFFGVGTRFVEHFGPENVRVLPNVTALQMAAARIKIPWQAIPARSLHGRDDYSGLYAAMLAHDWIAVYTDQINIPSAIAQRLLDKGAENYAMWVFEDLGMDKEYYDKYSLKDAACKNFSTLNLVLLEKTASPPCQLTLGMEDESFTTDNGLITKWPVRAAGLAALRPCPGNVLWDLGAGCGSVAIEASALMGRGQVVVVEKNAGRVAHIRENIRKFGALLVDVVHGTMPRCLADLPDPDRIFIGGGLSRTPEILDMVMDRLTPGGRLVVHCVLINSMLEARARLQARGWTVSLLQTQSSIATPLGADERFSPLNPVFLLTAQNVS